MPRQCGVDPDSPTPKDRLQRLPGGACMKRGKMKYDAVDFQKQLVFRQEVVSRYLEEEPLNDDFDELAQMLLGERRMPD